MGHVLEWRYNRHLGQKLGGEVSQYWNYRSGTQFFKRKYRWERYRTKWRGGGLTKESIKAAQLHNMANTKRIED